MRLRPLFLIAGILFAALAAMALDGFWLEPSSLRVTIYPIDLPGAGRTALKGLRIAVISDLHAGSPYIDEDKIRRVVTLTNGAHPDLILLTGDYVITHVPGGHHMPIETIAPLLGALHAPLGVHAIIGNHDRWENEPRIAAALRAAHIDVLQNASRAIATPRGTLWLAGIGDHYTHGSDPAKALAAIPARTRALCFTHSPDVFPELSAACLLTIAGHTHGGQVWLPILGRPAVAGVSIYGQRYAIGVIRENGKTLFVSSGIGTSGLPLRLGVPPEISVLDLR